MKILVISDTHKNIANVCDILNTIGDSISAVIHCGDVVEDVDFLKNRYKNIAFYNVSGNCDYGTGVLSENMFIIANKRFFVTHGHNYGVNYDISRLCYRGMELNADVCLYGHTHIPLIEHYDNMIIMNPGSLSKPRGGSKPSYGIVTIDDDISASIVEYK